MRDLRAISGPLGGRDLRVDSGVISGSILRSILDPAYISDAGSSI